MVGLDAGITSLYTLSAGEKITNPRHERKDRERLAKAQRVLATGGCDRPILSVVEDVLGVWGDRLGDVADRAGVGVPMRLRP